MLRNILFAAAASMLALSAFAADTSDIAKSIELKDGTTVYVFKDGKMGMANQFGHVVRMDHGQAMESKDGQRIVMVGDEVARLYNALRSDYRGR